MNIHTNLGRRWREIMDEVPELQVLIIYGILSGMEWEGLEAIEPGDLFRGRCSRQGKNCRRAIPKQ